MFRLGVAPGCSAWMRRRRGRRKRRRRRRRS
jgi:hypothetical protein